MDKFEMLSQNAHQYWIFEDIYNGFIIFFLSTLYFLIFLLSLLFFRATPFSGHNAHVPYAINKLLFNFWNSQFYKSTVIKMKNREENKNSGGHYEWDMNILSLVMQQKNTLKMIIAHVFSKFVKNFPLYLVTDQHSKIFIAHMLRSTKISVKNPALYFKYEGLTNIVDQVCFE